jgi:hypothetical protein
MNPTALATMTGQQWLSVIILIVLVGCAAYTAARLSAQRAERLRHRATVIPGRNPWEEFDKDQN